MNKFFSILSCAVLFIGLYFVGNGTSNYLFKNNINKINFNFLINYNHKVGIRNKNDIDSYTINKMYSEKNIEFIDTINLRKNNRIIVNLKNKPINPSIIKEGKSILLANYKNLDLFENINFKNTSGTKQDFIKTLLPLISYENQKIIVERRNLHSISKGLLSEKTLSKSDLSYLNKLARKYNIKIENKHKIDLVDELLISVDIIPNSIVIAQAANESGWGTSRFARDYNAIFGEYTYDFSKGVMPLKRENGKTHLVKAFSSPHKSVESYFKNINTHFAYKKFRLLRKLMRDKNNFSKINLLVEALDSYAEDEKYVQTISSIINSNNLNQYNIFSFSSSKS